jgi:hypothetical protein
MMTAFWVIVPSFLLQLDHTALFKKRIYFSETTTRRCIWKESTSRLHGAISEKNLLQRDYTALYLKRIYFSETTRRYIWNEST